MALANSLLISLGPHCAYFSHAKIETTSSKGVHCIAVMRDK